FRSRNVGLSLALLRFGNVTFRRDGRGPRHGRGSGTHARTWFVASRRRVLVFAATRSAVASFPQSQEDAAASTVAGCTPRGVGAVGGSQAGPVDGAVARIV